MSDRSEAYVAFDIPLTGLTQSPSSLALRASRLKREGTYGL